MPDGPTATVLSWMLRDLGLSADVMPHVADHQALSELQTAQTYSLVIFDAESADRSGRSMAESKCPLIVVSRFGDPHAAAMVESGKAHGVIEQPVGGPDTKALLECALDGIPALARVHERHSAPKNQTYDSFSGVHVLAADDSAINREVLCEALARLDVEVTSVESGAAAVEAFQRGRFDLVFMDGSMPDMDGFAASRAIREWETGHGRSPTPIVALTAHVVGRNADAWREAGMQDHVAKPFTLAAISDCLARWVTRQPKSRQRPSIASEPRSMGTDVDAGQTSAPILDPTVLESLADMQSPSGGLADRIVALFVEHAPSKLSDLLAEGATHDGAELPAAAHALKSMCLNIGATRLANLCDEIERDPRSGAESLDAERRERLSAVMAETLASLTAEVRAKAA